MTRFLSTTSALWIMIGLVGPRAMAQDASLAAYFGFEPLEVIRIGPQAGPMAAGDVNGDGLTDLLVVNNHASRIELHLQRPDARRDDAPPARHASTSSPSTGAFDARISPSRTG